MNFKILAAAILFFVPISALMRHIHKQGQLKRVLKAMFYCSIYCAWIGGCTWLLLTAKD
jgi:hypothetical protein